MGEIKIKTVRQIGKAWPEFSELMTEINSVNLPLTIFLGIVGILGILGNSCVILIYVKLKRKTPSIYFILTLAISDFAVCAIVIPTLIAVRFISVPVEYAHICKITIWYTYSLVGVSCAFLCIIAVDRYLAVCKTLKLRLSNKWAFIMSLGAVAIAFTIALLPALNSSIFIRMKFNNETVFVYPERCHITSLVSSKFREFDDRLITHIILFIIYVLMIISIAILYIVIFSTLRKREANWKMWKNSIQPVPTVIDPKLPIITIAGGTTAPAPRARKQVQQNTTFDFSSSSKLSTIISRRLFLVTLIYILTWLPFYLIEFNLMTHENILHKIFLISNMINPIIYPATSKVFRSQFKKVFCSKCLKDDEH